MVTTVRSLGLNGIAGYEVTAECFLSGGLPAFDIVGLPDAAVRESGPRRYEKGGYCLRPAHLRRAAGGGRRFTYPAQGRRLYR